MDGEEYERKMRKLKREKKALKMSGQDVDRLKKVKRDMRRLQEEWETQQVRERQ